MRARGRAVAPDLATPRAHPSRLPRGSTAPTRHESPTAGTQRGGSDRAREPPGHQAAKQPDEKPYHGGPQQSLAPLPLVRGLIQVERFGRADERRLRVLPHLLTRGHPPPSAISTSSGPNR